MDWKEGRRFRAYALDQQGWTGKRIAEALGVTKGAVSQWLKLAREQGRDALGKKPATGRHRKLTAEQRIELVTRLEAGSVAAGMGEGPWTLPRISQFIQKTFGVSYHPDHLSRVMRALDWSPQRPILRATQRDEQAIAGWRDERLPALKRGSTARIRTSPSSGSTKAPATAVRAE